MTPTVTLRRALEDPNLLGSALAGPSWATWRAILLAAMGEELKPDELELFSARTGRDQPPGKRVQELWAIVGRRGGKTQAIVHACRLPWRPRGSQRRASPWRAWRAAPDRPQHEAGQGGARLRDRPPRKYPYP